MVLLSALPPGSLVLELSQVEGSLGTNNVAPPHNDLDDILGSPDIDDVLVPGTCFVHGEVVSTAIRDSMDAKFGSGKARSVATLSVGELGLAPLLAESSCKAGEFVEGKSYLGLGLANHHVGSYYYARSLGVGAAAPAQGIGLRPAASGEDDAVELFWLLRRREKLTGAADPGNLPLEERKNSNDGKRSEWVDFLRPGDTVQVVPSSPAACLGALAASPCPCPAVFGVRREGRPPGSEPAVERKWVLAKADGKGWKPAEVAI